MKVEKIRQLALLSPDIVASNREDLIKGDRRAVLRTRTRLENPENNAPVSPEAGRKVGGVAVDKLHGLV